MSSRKSHSRKRTKTHKRRAGALHLRPNGNQPNENRIPRVNRPRISERARAISARHGYEPLRASELIGPMRNRHDPLRNRQNPVNYSYIPVVPNNMSQLTNIELENNASNATSWNEINFERPVLVLNNENSLEIPSRRVYQSNQSINHLRRTRRNPTTRGVIQRGTWKRPVHRRP